MVVHMHTGCFRNCEYQSFHVAILPAPSDAPGGAWVRVYILLRRNSDAMNARLCLHIMVLLMVLLPSWGYAAPVTSLIAPGLNVTGVTAAIVADNHTAFPLLLIWKQSGVTAIESYDASTGTMLRAELDGGGNPSGVDFPLAENSALYVYSSQLNMLALGESTSCAPLNLSAGFNLASSACFPPDYLASDFLTAAGLAHITSISRLDIASGRWQTAAVDGGTIVGDDFPLVGGEGYAIQTTAAIGWSPPLPPLLGLTPSTMTIWQGQAGAELTASIPSPAQAGGMTIYLASSEPALIGVAAQ